MRGRFPPEDFRASLEDLLRRHGRQLPSFFDAIVGARRCVRKPRACDLSAGIVTDARERTITLHSPGRTRTCCTSSPTRWPASCPQSSPSARAARPRAPAVPSRGLRSRTRGRADAQPVFQGLVTGRAPGWFRRQDPRPGRGGRHFVAPGHPGYSPACENTRDARPTGIWRGPDIERASALIERSRTAGRQVTVSVPTDKRRVGRYIARLLERLGYRSRLRVHGGYGDFHEYVADSRHHSQLGTDGWAADFPTPVDFTTPFTCDSYVPRSPANVNLAEFCDRAFERRIDAARAARGRAADARWRDVYSYLARSAPAAPLVNRRGAVLTSPRLGNYQHHPLFGILLDQAWVR